MVINNKPGKKDKKTLDFLKAEIITIKMIGHSASFVKKKQNFTRHVLNVRLGADGAINLQVGHVYTETPFIRSII